jgi:hypothetical protein
VSAQTSSSSTFLSPPAPILLAESLATCSSESSLPPLERAKSRALMDELPQLRARLMRACQPLLLLSKRAGAVPSSTYM